MSDFDMVREALAAKGLDYKIGKGGILVLPIEGGFRLVNLDKNGLPRRYRKEQLAVFVSLFPSLKELLVVNAETRRRAQYLTERLRNMASVHAESFDDKAPMPTLAQLSAHDPSTLPRFYALVDDPGYSSPNGKRLIVSIVASELPIATAKGGLRPDEALLQFEVLESKLDLKRLKSGELSLKDALRGVEAENVRIMYFDDNRPIRGARRLAHISKTLDTLAAWAEFATSTFDIRPVGDVYVHAEDYYGFENIESSGGRTKIDRFGPEAFPTNKNAARRAYFGGTVRRSVGADGKTLYRAVKGGRILHTMSGMSQLDEAAIARAVNRCVQQIRRALATLK